MRRLAFAITRHKHLVDLAIFLLVLPAYYYSPLIQADQVQYRSLVVGSELPSAITSYKLSYTIAYSSVIGSMELQFCSNDPLVGDVCDAPSGFYMSSASLDNESGIGDWAIKSSMNNSMVLTRAPAAVLTPQPVMIDLSNITNPNHVGPYYARITTYSSTDGSGQPSDFGGDALFIGGGISVSTYVPPYLEFCSGLTINGYDCTSATGAYINLGDLSYLHPSFSSSQMVAASNSGTGYTIEDGGTTLTSGNNIIDQLSSPQASQPGSAQFGLNLRDNTSPAVGADPSGQGSGEPAPNYNQPNLFQFQPYDVIASTSRADAVRKYTVSYLVNVASDQSPGIYDGSLTYICVANF
jgi:hypothetical protein